MSGPGVVREAADAARTFAADHRFDPEDSARLAIIVEELVANLYEHAGLTDGDGIDIALSLEGKEARLSLTDRGAPFDPRSAVHSGHVPERGGGAGLALVQRWAIRSDYRSDKSGNHLEIILPIGTPGG